MLYAADGIVESHAGVASALRDPRLVVARTGSWISHPSLNRRRLHPLRHLISRVLVFQEGANHTAIKLALGPSLLLPRLLAMQPALIQWAQQWLGSALDAPTADGNGLVAGLPRQSLALLLDFETPASLPAGPILGPISALLRASRPDAALLLEAQDAAEALLSWASSTQARWQAKGAVPELLSGLAPDEQQRSLCLLAFAGTETSQHLLAGLLDRWLHADGAERQAMQNQRQAVIREQLRWQSPIQYTVRRVAEAGVFDGHAMAVGQSLLLHLGRAQRDPIVYRQPEAFMAERTEGPGLSLGLGLHACLGAALARFQAEVLLAALALPEGQAWHAPHGTQPFVADPFHPSTGLVCRPASLSMQARAAQGQPMPRPQRLLCS